VGSQLFGLRLKLHGPFHPHKVVYGQLDGHIRHRRQLGKGITDGMRRIYPRGTNRKCLACSSELL